MLRILQFQPGGSVIGKMTKAEYYYKSTKHHREAIEHHEKMIDQDIHPEYHKERLDAHQAALAKLKEKGHNKKKPEQKDLGPLSSNPAMT
jgi:hypothetical protein